MRCYNYRLSEFGSGSARPGLVHVERVAQAQPMFASQPFVTADIDLLASCSVHSPVASAVMGPLAPFAAPARMSDLR